MKTGHVKSPRTCRFSILVLSSSLDLTYLRFTGRFTGAFVFVSNQRPILSLNRQRLSRAIADLASCQHTPLRTVRLFLDSICILGGSEGVASIKNDREDYRICPRKIVRAAKDVTSICTGAFVSGDVRSFSGVSGYDALGLHVFFLPRVGATDEEVIVVKDLI